MLGKKMKSFAELNEYDLLAKVELVKTEFGGRRGPIFDNYRGQLFWHINQEPCTDWLATYVFERGELSPGASAICKIILVGTIKEPGFATFEQGAQFAIREGSRIVAIGIILEVRTNA